MSYYECRRCLYKTKQKIDMARHINRKIKCTRNLESYKYSDDELNILSMQIIKNNTKEKNQGTPKECFENKGIQGNFENKNVQIMNHISTDDNESNYINRCLNCDKIFTRRSSLQRHLDKNRCKNIVYKTEQNITNITNNNNTIIINVNITKPLPFDSDWDVSKIDDTLKQVLLLSDLKYTKTLEHILENELNLNVIIEDKADCGIVYKNDIEKFKAMKLEDIVNLSMNKLHKQLILFHDEIKDHNKYNINNTILSSEKEILNEKYDEFKNNELTQKIVKNYIANIYNKKKEDTIKFCSELLDLDKIEGY
jgi:uncharacterized C2H2 Zn-finger protein